MEYQTTPAFIGVNVPRFRSVSIFYIAQSKPPFSSQTEPHPRARTKPTPTPRPKPRLKPTKKQKQPPPQTLVNANLTSPTVAAPTHTPSKLPSGHAARAAATQPAQASLETLTEAPLSRARSANCALPDRPAVSTGDPSHRAAAGPSMPSQIAREAAYSS